MQLKKVSDTQAIIATKAMTCGLPDIANLFWNIQKWTTIWNPIEKIEILYDDGENQEFLMQVWRDNVCEQVRTIRTIINNHDIEFFSPKPPPMMDYHVGSWEFKEIDSKVCEVIAKRKYSLKKLSKESDIDYKSRKEIFYKNFQSRLNNILTIFANHYNSTR